MRKESTSPEVPFTPRTLFCPTTCHRSAVAMEHSGRVTGKPEVIPREGLATTRNVWSALSKAETIALLKIHSDAREASLGVC
jgi:hypothetical protein